MRVFFTACLELLICIYGFGVTSLGYLSIENVRHLAGEDTGFCTACFGGEYPTQIPDETAKNRIETKISEK